MGIAIHATNMVTLLKNADLIHIRKYLMVIISTITTMGTRWRYEDQENGQKNSPKEPLILIGGIDSTHLYVQTMRTKDI